MTTILELPKNDARKYEPGEIYRWLQVQSEELGIDLVIYPDKARMEGHYLYIPAYLPGGKDAYDYAVKLEKFEVAWNDQEPRPDPPINLIPAKSPAQNAVWERLWRSRERKNDAADAAAEAEGEDAQQKALVELRAARLEEVQAQEEYNTLYQLN